MKNNENGRSMVEMLGVLAIIGVLSAGGLAGYSKAMFKHKLNTTMEQVTMLVTNIRTAYGQQKTYTNLTNTKAGSLGIVPAVMGTGDALTNPFKGGVRILGSAKVTAESAEGTAFTVAYDGLPKEACIALATADFGSGAGSGFVGVWVNNEDEAFIGTGNGKFTAGTGGAAGSYGESTRSEGQAYTMSQALAATACGAGEQNKITWKFY